MLTGHPVPGKEKSRVIVDAFVSGAPRNADGAVFYGVVPSMAGEFRRARDSGAPWFYCDNAYFDDARGHYFRVTKNRLQHDGSGGTNGKRLAALGVQIEPRRRGGEYALAIEQSEMFMRHVARQDGWLSKALYGLGPVRIRPWSSDKPRLAASFHEDLRLASVLVTYSSAAAVEAVIAGVPVVVSKDSAAYCMNGSLPSEGERARWAGVLADHQFTLAEMRSGYAWEVLNA